jgi:hypothetical protein
VGGPNTAGTPESLPPPTDATAPRLSGNWQATEVIVFDRSAVGLSPKGEQLLSDAPRRLPARITSFDPPGAGGAVLYAGDRAIAACLWAPAGSLQAGEPAPGSLPAAFRAPEPASSAEEQSPVEQSTAGAQTEAPQTQSDAPQAPPDPLLEFQRALREYESALADQSLSWLPASANRLGAGARRLAEQGGYRILFHHTWIQDLTGPEPSPLILVQSDRDAAGLALLEGTIQLRRDRGLRFAAELWYRGPETAAESTSQDASASTAVAPDAAARPQGRSYIRLADSRRLADGQVYYVDHPKLGIIVRTTAVAIPDEILQAWSALSAPVEQPREAPAQPPTSPLR